MGVEVTERHDPTLYNKDLAPISPEERSWGTYNYASLWVAMSVCIPTYMLASGLIAGGMNWWEAVGTVLLGNLIVLIPMLLNGHAGTKYGIPFPVFVRSSFGVRGANIPALLRALVACGWFGIQTWVGGEAIFDRGRIRHDAHHRLLDLAGRREHGGRSVDLLLRFLAGEHGCHLARDRHHPVSGKHQRSVHAGYRDTASLVDLAAGWRPRACTQRAQQVPLRR